MGEALNLAIMLTLKDAASAGLSSIGEKMSGVGKVAAGLAGAAVAGVGALGAALWDAGKAAGEEEVGVARLGAAVTASGADWATAQASIESYLAAQTERVALDDGEGRNALARLTTTTGDYKAAMDLLPLAIDLAAAKQIPLATAAELVGKVSEGNTGVLKKYGIVLEEGASATDALAAMQQKFAGQGEAFAGTFEGQQQRMGIALGNLKETIGGAVLPVMTQMAEAGADLATRALPWIENALNNLKPVFDQVVEAVRVGVEWMQAFWAEHGAQIMATVSALWEGIKVAVTTAIEALKPVIAAIVEAVSAALEAIRGFWAAHGEQILAALKILWQTLQGVFEGGLKVLKDVFAVFTAVFKGDWSGAWEAVKKLFTDKLDLIKTAFTGILNTIAALFGTSLPEVLGKITEFGANALTAIKKPFQDAYDWLTGLWGRIRDFFAHLFDGVHIPTPHFSLTTEDRNIAGINVPVPKINIDWYGSGLDAIFNSPSIIGVGERGAERVTVTPLRPGLAGAGAGASSGTTYNLTYVDQRPGGGAPDMMAVARQLEWQARMRR